MRQAGPNRGGWYGLQELIAVSAFLVSVASIVIAYQENRASKQLVQASSLPYLSLTSTFDRSADGKIVGVIRTLENDGVGPADVRFVDMRFRNRPYADLSDLLRACCDVEPKTTASLTARMIRPGIAVDFLVLKARATADPGIDRYARLVQAGEITTNICYCSVFSECWTLGTNSNGRPAPAKECPAPAPDAP